nr:GTP-binding protein [uncultured Halomonas sp.]
MNSSPVSIGVTVIAGFLGSGKTTLINHLLTHADGRRLAIMVNDFGALNIDRELISEEEEGLISLSNGCVCCNLQGELASSIEGLLINRGERLDHVLIECSGVSDPARVVSVLRYPSLRQRCHLDAVMTLIDLSRSLNSSQGELRALLQSQIACADWLVLNKADQALPGIHAELKENWLLPNARVIETEQARLPAELVFWRSDAPVSLEPSAKDAIHHHTGIAELGLSSHSFEHRGAMDGAKLSTLLQGLPGAILRIKGVVQLEDGRQLELQRAAGQLETRPFPHRDTPGTRLVFIGQTAECDWPALDRDLQALAR